MGEGGLRAAHSSCWVSMTNTHGMMFEHRFILYPKPSNSALGPYMVSFVTYLLHQELNSLISSRNDQIFSPFLTSTGSSCHNESPKA